MGKIEELEKRLEMFDVTMAHVLYPRGVEVNRNTLWQLLAVVRAAKGSVSNIGEVCCVPTGWDELEQALAALEGEG